MFREITKEEAEKIIGKIPENKEIVRALYDDETKVLKVRYRSRLKNAEVAKED